MFKVAVFHLVGPICKCNTQDLMWSVIPGRTGAELVITCRLCDTRHVIGSQQFLARIELEVPYPNKQTQKSNDAGDKKPEREDSKVVQLFPDKK